MKKIVLKIVDYLGYRIEKKRTIRNFSSESIEQEFLEIYDLCKPYTMTSIERMYSLYKAVEYIVKNDIKGEFVECGVWRGGSVMLIAQMLANRGIQEKKIYLYDTFEGMSEATSLDVSSDGRVAKSKMNEYGYNEDGSSKWCYADLKDVKKNLGLTNYKSSNFSFIKGKVEDTIPSKIPDENIALLRLDTDWYESTKHELIHLFPKISSNGVLIIDDYGAWNGCKKAVDEYFGSQEFQLLLNRIDYTGRIAIKTIANRVDGSARNN